MVRIKATLKLMRILKQKRMQKNGQSSAVWRATKRGGTMVNQVMCFTRASIACLSTSSTERRLITLKTKRCVGVVFRRSSLFLERGDKCV
jgi:hypothetical protein